MWSSEDVLWMMIALFLVIGAICVDTRPRQEPPRDSLNYAERTVFDATKSCNESSMGLFRSLLAKDSEAAKLYEDSDEILELIEKWQTSGISLWRLCEVREGKVSETPTPIPTEPDYVRMVEQWSAEVDLTVDTKNACGKLFARFVLEGEVSYDYMTLDAEKREQEKMNQEAEKARSEGRSYFGYLKTRKNEVGGSWSGNPTNWKISKIIVD